MLLREATSETYGSRVYLHHINLPILSYFLCFYFASLSKKYQNIILSYLSDLTLVSDREGIDNPLSRWLRGVICFVQVLGTRTQPPTGLIPWFSKTKENTYATLLHHPLLFGEIQRSAQEVARRISGAIAGEVRASQDLTSDNKSFLASMQKLTYQVPITTIISRITLFAICLSFSSHPLHPCRFIRPLSLSSLSFSICLF